MSNTKQSIYTDEHKAILLKLKIKTLTDNMNIDNCAKSLSEIASLQHKVECLKRSNKIVQGIDYGVRAVPGVNIW